MLSSDVALFFFFTCCIKSVRARLTNVTVRGRRCHDIYEREVHVIGPLVEDQTVDQTVVSFLVTSRLQVSNNKIWKHVKG